ncbi:PEP-CTERM sorting domain-containing protein [Roseateles sp. LYH14W]|uniref:PEP-CTERM sorting domain-containing protein n=1 Tax=Pelomonas parva TaxID=3299032 RepID=A0ABW7F5A0_9BURK
MPTPAPSPVPVPTPAPAPSPVDLPPATALRQNPVSDGDACAGCAYFVESSFVYVVGSLTGQVKFATPLSTNVGRAWLSLNRLGGTADAHAVSVFGVGSDSVQLAIGELRAGSLLGELQIPAGLSAGQEVFLDVTDFVRSTPAAYLSFNLYSTGAVDLFSSLEINEGLPSQLILSAVPEPSEAALMFAGLLTLAGWLRRRAFKAPA